MLERVLVWQQRWSTSDLSGNSRVKTTAIVGWAAGGMGWRRKEELELG